MLYTEMHQLIMFGYKEYDSPILIDLEFPLLLIPLVTLQNFVLMLSIEKTKFF